MTESARAYSGGDIEDDVVRTQGVPRDAANGWDLARPHVIQPQVVADAPGDIMVRAGRIAAHADASYDLVARRVEREPAAKYVHAADFSSDHRVGDRALSLIHI